MNATLQQLMPTFFAGITTLHNAFMLPCMVIVYAGLAHQALAKMDLRSLGWSIFRVSIIAFLVGNMFAIGDILTGIATGVAQQAGLSFDMQLFNDYQQAITTKLSNSLQRGGNPWDFITNPLGAPGQAFLGSIILVLNVVASSIMWFCFALQTILLALEMAVAPILLATIMIPSLSGLATRWATAFVALTMMPIGWAVLDLLVKAILGFAVNQSNNTGIAVANILGGSMMFWILLPIVVIMGFPISGFLICKSLVTTGQHNLHMFPNMLVGMALGTGMTAAGIAMNTGSMANQIVGPPAQPYKNHTVRP